MYKPLYDYFEKHLSKRQHGPLLFCILINDLPDVLRFIDPYLFADDLKILSKGYSDTEFQEDINAVQNWVATNKMQLAVEKCAILNIRGPDGRLI